MKVTELYTKKIYNHNGHYIDEVSDVMISINKGKISIIAVITPTLEKKKQMIPYRAIKAIGDIIILE